MALNFLHSVKGRLLNIHRPGSRPDIFLFATPRSGSTFLMEILSAQAGMKIVNEPLQIGQPHIAASLGWSSWEEAGRAADRKAVFQAHFSRIRSNDLPPVNRPPYRRGGRFITDRITFKILHGGEDLAPWFEETFGGLILALTRHPIPTAYSHVSYPRLPYYLEQPGLAETFTDDERAVIAAAIDSTDHLRMGVADWCAQNKFFTPTYWRPTWTRVSYEALTLAPRETVESLYGPLRLNPVENIEALAKRPSRSTRFSSSETRSHFSNSEEADPAFLVERWVAKTGADDIAFTQEALDAFGVTDYRADDPYPVGFSNARAGSAAPLGAAS